MIFTETVHRVCILADQQTNEPIVRLPLGHFSVVVSDLGSDLWDISLWWWETLLLTLRHCSAECVLVADLKTFSVLPSLSLLLTLGHFSVMMSVLVTALETLQCWARPCYWPWDTAVLSLSLLLTLRHFLCGTKHVPVTDLETYISLQYWVCPCYWPWDTVMLSVSLLLTLRHCSAECVLVTDLETLQCWVCPCYWPWDIAVLSLSLLLTLRHCSAAYVPVTDLETFLCGAQCVPVDSHVAMWLQEFLPNGALPWCRAPHHHHHFLALVNTSTPPLPCAGQHINPTITLSWSTHQPHYWSLS